MHGFKAPTSRAEVRKAIEEVKLEQLLHEEVVSAGDVIFVPAGTVHAIGSGVMLYELQEYSDITYRMYDYGRLTAAGTPRELHIAQSLDVSRYEVSLKVKVQPVALPGGQGYEDHCLAACQYFVTRELIFHQSGNMKDETKDSCIILTSLGAEVQIRYGNALGCAERLARGQTMVLPARLGNYCIEGAGRLMLSYVPRPGDEAWRLWEEKNRA